MPTWRVTFSGLLWSNNWNNVVHFHTEAGSYTNATLAAHLNANWVEKIRAFQHDQLQWLNIQVRDVTSAPLNAPYNLAINKVGTSSAATATDTNLVTIVLRFYTALAGRSGRGRILIAGVPSGRFNLGIITPTNLGIFQTIANDLYAIYGVGSASGIQLVVAARAIGSPVRSVTAINVRATQGTCRSRGYGIGT